MTAVVRPVGQKEDRISQSGESKTSCSRGKCQNMEWHGHEETRAHRTLQGREPTLPEVKHSTSNTSGKRANPPRGQTQHRILWNWCQNMEWHGHEETRAHRTLQEREPALPEVKYSTEFCETDVKTWSDMATRRREHIGHFREESQPSQRSNTAPNSMKLMS